MQVTADEPPAPPVPRAPPAPVMGSSSAITYPTTGGLPVTPPVPVVVVGPLLGQPPPGLHTGPESVSYSVCPGGQQGFGVTVTVLLLAFDGEAWTKVMLAPPK